VLHFKELVLYRSVGTSTLLELPFISAEPPHIGHQTRFSEQRVGLIFTSFVDLWWGCFAGCGHPEGPIVASGGGFAGVVWGWVAWSGCVGAGCGDG
jgi:hypothetical protein